MGNLSNWGWANLRSYPASLHLIPGKEGMVYLHPPLKKKKAGAWSQDRVELKLLIFASRSKTRVTHYLTVTLVWKWKISDFGILRSSLIPLYSVKMSWKWRVCNIKSDRTSSAKAIVEVYLLQRDLSIPCFVIALCWALHLPFYLLCHCHVDSFTELFIWS